LQAKLDAMRNEKQRKLQERLAGQGGDGNAEVLAAQAVAELAAETKLAADAAGITATAMAALAGAASGPDATDEMTAAWEAQQGDLQAKLDAMRNEKQRKLQERLAGQGGDGNAEVLAAQAVAELAAETKLAVDAAAAAMGIGNLGDSDLLARWAEREKQLNKALEAESNDRASKLRQRLAARAAGGVPEGAVEDVEALAAEFAKAAGEAVELEATHAAAEAVSRGDSGLFEKYNKQVDDVRKTLNGQAEKRGDALRERLAARKAKAAASSLAGFEQEQELEAAEEMEKVAEMEARIKAAQVTDFAQQMGLSGDQLAQLQNILDRDAETAKTAASSMLASQMSIRGGSLEGSMPEELTQMDIQGLSDDQAKALQERLSSERKLVRESLEKEKSRQSELLSARVAGRRAAKANAEKIKAEAKKSLQSSLLSGDATAETASVLVSAAVASAAIEVADVVAEEEEKVHEKMVADTKDGDTLTRLQLQLAKEQADIQARMRDSREQKSAALKRQLAERRKKAQKSKKKDEDENIPLIHAPEQGEDLMPTSHPTLDPRVVQDIKTKVNFRSAQLMKAGPAKRLMIQGQQMQESLAHQNRMAKLQTISDQLQQELSQAVPGEQLHALANMVDKYITNVQDARDLETSLTKSQGAVSKAGRKWLGKATTVAPLQADVEAPPLKPPSSSSPLPSSSSPDAAHLGMLFRAPTTKKGGSLPPL